MLQSFYSMGKKLRSYAEKKWDRFIRMFEKEDKKGQEGQGNAALSTGAYVKNT
ncbi:hypothetical protein P343_08380 [Sporolactobacillus laevolacticus DSM 442]|uniref:Uncharacterized protein n=1 Tax=Sporolactobacillus laevolacticus DSM 442 TaxID=1395513 RepID=V6J653_9BACL|nr:hypothetical protein P343_08380 [Sporolactobacillus laevolacticus DSM 442]